MKIEEKDDELVLFLKKQEMNDFCFEELDEIEEYFRSLFLNLDEYYHITIEGFYNIHVYLDEIEGMVLTLQKEDLDYYPFHQVEMQIVKEDTTFLYEIEEPLDFLSSNFDIYVYQNHFYVKKKTKEGYSPYEWGKLVYEGTKEILKRGKLLTHV